MVNIIVAEVIMNFLWRKIMTNIELLLWFISHKTNILKIKNGYSLEVWFYYKDSENNKVDVYTGKTIKECIMKAIDDE